MNRTSRRKPTAALAAARRRPLALSLVAVLGLTVLAAPGSYGSTGTAHAQTAPTGSLYEQRLPIKEAYYAAGREYAAARLLTGAVPRVQEVALKNAITAGSASLKAVSHLYTAAGTPDQESVTRAAETMRAELLRATTVHQVAKNLGRLHVLRGEQHGVARKALEDLSAKRLSTTAYTATQDRASAFSTHLAADAAAQIAVLGKTEVAPALRVEAWHGSLVGATGTIPAATGWVGFPGGCALPVASSVFRPRLPSSGPGVVTTRAQVERAKAVALADPQLAEVHAQMVRFAKASAATAPDPRSAWVWYPTRVSRLGYGWLSGGDSASRAALQAEARSVLGAGPESMNSLRASTVLIAAATAADWTDLTGQEQTVLVRWIGPQTCLHADGDSYVKNATNIPVVHNTATFLASAVFLQADPVRAAALAKMSLVSVRPALRVLTTDGGTFEGPDYWTFQSRPVTSLYSTLRSAYTTSPFALPSLTAVSRYALNSTAPDGRPTAFADAEPDPLSPLMPAWDAHVRQDAAVGAWVRARLLETPDAQLMWWTSPVGTRPAPRSAVYPLTGLAVLQAAPGTATLKAGSNATNHAHLDLGAVSFHRRGVQWSVDPGAGDYDQPGYNSLPARWGYWETTTAAHSTLSVTGKDQPATAAAAITASSASSATVDLRQALPGTSTATRSVVHGTTSMVVKDTVRSPVPVDLTWRWVTDAAVTVASDRAVLRKDGKSATVRFAGVPAGSVLTAVPAPGPGPDGARLTVVTLSMKAVTSLDLSATAY